jgi:hypothetical protein
MCVVRSSPYRCAWDTGSGFTRSYSVTARARDAAGNIAEYLRTYEGAK